jgi:hypothetical protein
MDPTSLRQRTSNIIRALANHASPEYKPKKIHKNIRPVNIACRIRDCKPTVRVSGQLVTCVT